MVVAKISELLKYKRRENGLTQAAVAKKLYVSRQAVSNWETGRHLPDVILIKKLANIYGITIDELISGREEEKVEKSNFTITLTLLYPLLLLVTLITSRLTIASNSRALLVIDGLILLSIMLVFLTKFTNSKIQILMRVFSLTVFLSCTFINDILNDFSFQTTTFISSLILLWQLFSTYYYPKKGVVSNMKLKIWWLGNLIWLLIFGVLSFILMTRRIDGSGTVQTPKARLVSLSVLAVFFIIVLLIPLVILIFVRRK